MGWFSLSSVLTFVLAIFALIPTMRDAEEFILNGLPASWQRFRIAARVVYVIAVLALTVGVIVTSNKERESQNDATIARQEKIAKDSHDWDTAQFKQVVAAIAKLAPGPGTSRIVNNYYRSVVDPSKQPPSEVTMENIEVAQPTPDVAGWHALANVHYQNGAAAGTAWFQYGSYLSSRLASDYWKADSKIAKGKARSGSLSFPTPVTPNERQWFTVVSDPTSIPEVNALLSGNRIFYVAGTIFVKNNYGESKTPFCQFTVGKPPYIMHDCPND